MARVRDLSGNGGRRNLGFADPALYDIEATVFDYGVIPDGVTVNTTALQDALNTLSAAGGGQMYAPNNGYDYILDATVTIPDNVQLLGLGFPTLKMVSASNSRMIAFNGTTDSAVRGFIMDGNSSVTPTDALVVFLNTCEDCHLEGNVFINAPSASTGTVALSGSGVTKCYVLDNKFENPEGTAIGLAGCQECTVAFNDFDQGGGFGIHMTASAQKNTILANRGKNSALEVIGMNYTCSLNIIQGNYAEGTGDNGISISGDYNTVVGNTCVANDNAGIGVWGSYNSITGNVCKNNRQGGLSTWAGIWIHAGFGGRGSYNTISGNTCDDDQAVPTQAYGVRIELTGYTNWGAGQVISGAGVFRVNGLNLYVSTGSGTTGGSAPVHTSGSVSDGAVTWTYISSWLIAARPEGNTTVGNTLGRAVTATYTDSNASTDNLVIDRTQDVVLTDSKLLLGRATPVTYTSAQGLLVNGGSGNPGINLETTNSASVAAITCGLNDVQDGRIEYNFASDYWDFYTANTQRYRMGSTNFRAATDNAIDLGQAAQRFKITYSYSLNLGSAGCTISTGAGSPEGVLTAPVGSLYLNTSGGASTTLYVKTSGAGNTGWTAK